MIKHKDYQISIVDKFGMVLYRYCGDNYKINFYELGTHRYYHIYYNNSIDLLMLIDDFTKHYLYSENMTYLNKVNLIKYLKSLLCADGNRIEILYNDGDKCYLYIMEELYKLDIYYTIDDCSKGYYREHFMKIYFNHHKVVE